MEHRDDDRGRLRELLRGAVQLVPAGWTASEGPGDMERFLPLGLCLGGPVVLRPWDDPGRALASFDNYYGAQPRTGHPMRDAPLTEPAGGVVYFDEVASREAFFSLLDCLGVRRLATEYLVFAAEAEDPRASRYLHQLRTLTPSALASPEELRRQPLSLGDLLYTFVTREREWFLGQGWYELSGSFGGDDDWAKERLCFGLMVENHTFMAYRIWSRAWLVTK